jgi:hypothetical protein
MRYAGLGVTGVLAVCLCAVVVAMTGGPQAPFTHWAVQRAAPAGGASQHANGHSPKPGRSSVAPAPGTGNPASQGSPPSPSAGSSPSASTGASPTASPSATATRGTTAPASPTSPGPTNPAGKTPPGHTKSPNPHKSRSVA